MTEHARRAARRLRLDRRDGGAARPGAGGAVPGAGVRRGPPSARRVVRTTSSSPSTRMRGPAGGRRLHARRAAAPRRDARALPPGATPLLRPARPADRGSRERVGPGGEDEARARGRRSTRVLQADRGDRVRRKNDDGVGRGLDDADIVLVGVSRTSKTPLSIYLGYLGCKAANVPIVKGIEPPTELFEIDPAKIVGLTIDADRLAEIRRERVRADGRAGPRPPVRRARRDLRGARAGDEIHRGSAARSSTSPSCRSRRPRTASSASSRSAPKRRRQPPRDEAEAAASRCGGGASGGSLLALATRPLLRALHARLVRASARSRGSRSSVQGAADRDELPHVTTSRTDDPLRLRLRRVLAGRPRAPRRQGDRPRRDDAARRPRAGRLHDHDRRVPRLHGRGRRAPTVSTTRWPSTSRGSRSRPASASAIPRTRCSSRSAPARRSRCPG